MQVQGRRAERGREQLHRPLLLQVLAGKWKGASPATLWRQPAFLSAAVVAAAPFSKCWRIRHHACLPRQQPSLCVLAVICLRSACKCTARPGPLLPPLTVYRPLLLLPAPQVTGIVGQMLGAQGGMQ